MSKVFREISKVFRKISKQFDNLRNVLVVYVLIYNRREE